MSCSFLLIPVIILNCNVNHDLNPNYAIELRDEALRCNKYWCFLNFSVAPKLRGYGEIKKYREALVFAVAQRCNRFSIA